MFRVAVRKILAWQQEPRSDHRHKNDTVNKTFYLEHITAGNNITLHSSQGSTFKIRISLRRHLIRLLERTDSDELSHKCVDLAEFYDTDTAASELNSEVPVAARGYLPPGANVCVAAPNPPSGVFTGM